MHTPKWIYFSACCLGLLLAAPDASHAQSPTPTDKSLPVLLEWSTPNMQALCNAWLATVPGQTAQSPALKNYRAALAREDVGTLFYLRPWIGLDWTDLAAIDDRITIVVVPAEKSGTMLALWVQGQPNSPSVKLCRKVATEYWEKSKYQTSSSRSGELTVQRFTKKGKGNATDERCLVTTNDGLLLTTRATDYTALIAIMQRQSTDATAANVKKPPEEKGATASFSLKPLSLARRRQARNAESRDWAVSAARVGGDQLDQLQGEMVLAPEEVNSIQFRIRCQLTAPLKLAMRLLAMPGGEQWSPTALATAQDDTLSTWRWTSGPPLDAFGNLFDELVEPGEFGQGLFADLLEGLKEDPESPQVDLRRELFELLGPRFRSFSQISDPKTNLRQSLLAAECTGEKRERVQTALAKFFKGDSAVAAEEIAKHQCWSVEPGKSLFVEVESEDLVSYRAVAIGPEGFFLATDPAILKAALTQNMPLTSTDKALWEQLLSASKTDSPDIAGGRILLNTSRRFTAALEVAYAQAPPYSTWEPGWLRWLIYGDDTSAQKLTSQDVPAPADLQGFFQPGWLVFEQQPDQLQLNIGFVSKVTSPAE